MAKGTKLVSKSTTKEVIKIALGFALGSVFVIPAFAYIKSKMGV